MGQTNDWMAEIYPRWVAAHGVFILCPVHWYQAPASLKLMIDRLVCADGGNPDPTTTHGKDPARGQGAGARRLALSAATSPAAPSRWSRTATPKVMKACARRWWNGYSSIGMHQAGTSAAVDTLIGYYEPYATSHDKLDEQPDTFVLVENAAKSLVNLVRDLRSGSWRAPDAGLKNPRQK